MAWELPRYGRTLPPGKQRTTLCHEGWYYLLVLAFVVTGSILREINLLVVMAGMMAGPLVLNGWIASRALRGLAVKRHLPPSVAAGDLLEVRLSILKRPLGRRPRATFGLLLEDRIERIGTESEVAAPKALVWRVAPGISRETSYRVRLLDRGRYRFGPLTASSRYPLGLIRRSLGLGRQHELVVFPRLGQLQPGWLQSLHDAFRGERFSHLRPGGAQGDFHRLREWRAGDSLRWIHWRTTARRGVPIVREFELPSEPNYAVVLDLEPGEEPGFLRLDHDRVEQAVSFAATLAAEICRTGGARLAVACHHRGCRLHMAAASQHLLREILETLASCQPTAEDHLPAMLEMLLERIEGDTRVVLVTARGDEAARIAEAASLQADPRHRRLSDRLTVVDISDERFGEFFRCEPASREQEAAAV